MGPERVRLPNANIIPYLDRDLCPCGIPLKDRILYEDSSLTDVGDEVDTSQFKNTVKRCPVPGCAEILSCPLSSWINDGQGGRKQRYWQQTFASPVFHDCLKVRMHRKGIEYEYASLPLVKNSKEILQGESEDKLPTPLREHSDRIKAAMAAQSARSVFTPADKSRPQKRSAAKPSRRSNKRHKGTIRQASPPR